MAEKPFKAEDREPRRGAPMDNPEQINTDKESINEMHKEQMTVDIIPLEDQRMEQVEEKNKHGQKHSSSTEEKYNGGEREY